MRIYQITRKPIIRLAKKTIVRDKNETFFDGTLVFSFFLRII